MSTSDKQEYNYTVTLTEDNFIASESLMSSLPDEFFQKVEDSPDDSTETQVHLISEDESHIGKLISFESQNDQTVLYCEMRKSSALRLITGKRFETVSVRHEGNDLWVSNDVPKLKDTVSVDLNGSEAYVTLTIRKISMHGRHK